MDLFEADLFSPGSYDAAFAGCAAVVHTAAPLGYNRETPQQTYDGCFTQTQPIIDSTLKARTVKRFVFTSSFAAVTYPCEDGYVFTEQDWADEHPDAYGGSWTTENIPKNRGIAYKMSKCASERLLYETAGEGRQLRGDGHHAGLRHRTGDVRQPTTRCRASSTGSRK